MQAADAHHHLRDRRGRLIARPHRDRVPVVGDDVEDGQAEPARGVQALPELALRARALAERDVGDLVAVRGAAGKVAPDDVAPRLRATDRREALAARRARLAHDVARRVTPVTRHLATARRRVVRAADRLKQDLERRDAETEDEGAVPVVGEEPVVAGAQRPGEAEQQRLVAGARDLEEHLALLAERDLAVVDRAGDASEAVVGERFVERHVPVPVAPVPVGMVREPIEQLHYLGGYDRKNRSWWNPRDYRVNRGHRPSGPPPSPAPNAAGVPVAGGAPTDRRAPSSTPPPITGTGTAGRVTRDDRPRLSGQQSRDERRPPQPDPAADRREPAALAARCSPRVHRDGGRLRARGPGPKGERSSHSSPSSRARSSTPSRSSRT